MSVQTHVNFNELFMTKVKQIDYDLLKNHGLVNPNKARRLGVRRIGFLGVEKIAGVRKNPRIN